MTTPVALRFDPLDTDEIATLEGRLAVLVPADGKLDPAARRVNRLTRGALARLVESAEFVDLAAGGALEMGFPAGLAVRAVQVVKLDRKVTALAARRAGAEIAKSRGCHAVHIFAGAHARAAEIAFGFALRAYEFTDFRTIEPPRPAGPARVLATKPEAVAAQARDMAARAEGVFFTRDLVTAPANELTTLDFAARLAAMQELGLEVEILDENEMSALGMGALLAVGQGSESPSRLVVMRWQGGGSELPVALVGKGVVFDTGGISIKPAQGMEEMVADMGGAGVVAGVMRTLALRQARANVIGVVGLVENMPSGRATRPGDVVRSMKGDTIEIINTDAEGRLVLADALWYVQERFQPRAVVDLATLTGAAIVALGHEKAGLFANDEALADAVLEAAAAEGEGAWRLPLGPAYDRQLKSRVADMKNTGGRPAGAITAAQFLQRFVKDGTAWVHLDIAGVCFTPEATAFAPRGASGWGVLTLDRLVRDLCGG